MKDPTYYFENSTFITMLGFHLKNTKRRFFSDHLCNTFLPSYDVVLKRTETKKSSRLHWVVFFYDLSKNKNPIITKTKPSK